MLVLEVPPDTTDGHPVAVRVDHQQRYWVFRREELPAVFDAQGNFLQVVGRTGDGPGEYRQPYDLLLVSRDTLLILDGNGLRGTFLDTTLTPIGYTRLPLELHNPVIMSWPDALYGGGAIPFLEERGSMYQLTFEGRNAEAARQFHSYHGVGDGYLGFTSIQRLSTPRDGRFWSAWERSYDLTEYTHDGRQRRTLERRPSWFSDISPMNWAWRDEAPPPLIAALEHDADGRLWVFVHIARPTWREGWAAVPPGLPEAPGRLMAVEKLWRTMVEVIDPDARRVVVRSQLDGYIINPPARGAGRHV